MDGVVKYLKVQNIEGIGFNKKTKLILSNCDLKDEEIYNLVGGLLRASSFELDILDLSLNLISDVGC